MTTACCSNYSTKRFMSFVVFECFACKNNYHAECLEANGEMEKPTDLNRLMTKYPAIKFWCKLCRKSNEAPLVKTVKILSEKVDKLIKELDNLKNIGEKVNEMKDEINIGNGKKNAHQSWASMAKKFKENNSKSVVVIKSKDETVNAGDLKKIMKNKLKDEPKMMPKIWDDIFE